VLTSSRHPRANGQVERAHSEVMAVIMTRNDAPNGWDNGLPKVKRCLINSESKVTRRTPFELLHDYRARFRLGTLRAVTTSSDNWPMPQELWNEARDQLEGSKSKTKAAFDRHRHNNTRFNRRRDSGDETRTYCYG